MKDTNVTLINLFSVPPGKLEEAIAMWEKARDFMAREPGFISTDLHQSQTSNARYQLVNVAKWESREDFLLAMTKMRDALDLPRVEGLESNPALYNVIRS
jgi:quinol monooxygenase YgiN